MTGWTLVPSSPKNILSLYWFVPPYWPYQSHAISPQFKLEGFRTRWSFDSNYTKHLKFLRWCLSSSSTRVNSNVVSNFFNNSLYTRTIQFAKVPATFTSLNSVSDEFEHLQVKSPLLHSAVQLWLWYLPSRLAIQI